MSCIHLHLGQAGNQIGKAFWGLAEEEYLVRGSDGSMLHPARRASGGRTNAHMATVMMRPGAGGMFHDDGFARCLAVDSEPKASRACRCFHIRWSTILPCLRLSFNTHTLRPRPICCAVCKCTCFPLSRFSKLMFFCMRA